MIIIYLLSSKARIYPLSGYLGCFVKRFYFVWSEEPWSCQECSGGGGAVAVSSRWVVSIAKVAVRIGIGWGVVGNEDVIGPYDEAEFMECTLLELYFPVWSSFTGPNPGLFTSENKKALESYWYPVLEPIKEKRNWKQVSFATFRILIYQIYYIS